jgi:hypothetical protein
MKTRLINGQATVELTVSIFCMLLLLFGILQVFWWANSWMVQRQRGYERSRIEAASVNPDDPNPERQVDESGYSKLDIFRGD